MSVDHRAGGFATGHETHFCYVTSLQGFSYSNVVHKFEKPYKTLHKLMVCQSLKDRQINSQSTDLQAF